MKRDTDWESGVVIMEYVKPDLLKLSKYIDNMTIKSAMIGGFDKIDVYQNMQALCRKYDKLINTKIEALFKRCCETIESLSNQNVQLKQMLAMKTQNEQVQADVRVSLDSYALRQENARLSAELENLKNEYNKLWSENSMFNQKKE